MTSLYRQLQSFVLTYLFFTRKVAVADPEIYEGALNKKHHLRFCSSRTIEVQM